MKMDWQTRSRFNAQWDYLIIVNGKTKYGFYRTTSLASYERVKAKLESEGFVVSLVHNI